MQLRQHLIGFLACTLASAISYAATQVLSPQVRRFTPARFQAAAAAEHWRIIVTWHENNLGSNDCNSQSISGNVVEIGGTPPAHAFFVREHYSSRACAARAMGDRLVGAQVSSFPSESAISRQHWQPVVARYDRRPAIGSGTGFESEEHRWALVWVADKRLYWFYAPSAELVTDTERLVAVESHGLLSAELPVAAERAQR